MFRLSGLECRGGSIWEFPRSKGFLCALVMGSCFEFGVHNGYVHWNHPSNSMQHPYLLRWPGSLVPVAFLYIAAVSPRFPFQGS